MHCFKIPASVLDNWIFLGGLLLKDGALKVFLYLCLLYSKCFWYNICVSPEGCKYFLSDLPPISLCLAKILPLTEVHPSFFRVSIIAHCDSIRDGILLPFQWVTIFLDLTGIVQMYHLWFSVLGTVGLASRTPHSAGCYCVVLGRPRNCFYLWVVSADNNWVFVSGEFIYYLLLKWGRLQFSL